MNITEYFARGSSNRSTEFSDDIKDYRLLTNIYEIDNEYVASENYAEYYEEYRNKGLFVVTADREIPCNDLFYWLGDLIIDKDNNILDNIAFN